MSATINLVCVLVILLSVVTNSLKHDLKITNDRRSNFFIENFGFEAGGELHMQILNFKVDGKPFSVDARDKVGFLIKRTETYSTAFIEEDPVSKESKDCLTALADMRDILVYINDTNQGSYTEKNIKIEEGSEGLYNTWLIHCVKASISFELKLVQFNVDALGNPNYLSSGYSPLPTVYGFFTLAYVACLVIWIFSFLRGAGSQVNRIHHLMTVLILLKLLSLFFKTIEYHYIKTTGSAGGWNIAYYIFAGLKGVMLFVLIALIGTGWTFIKPFLSDKDKKIFLIVIPLQILDNIAMIMIEETAPGSQKWFTWKDIFRIVDIICCGAILIPIIWSIKHLREASSSDGKAARNVRKLTLFRQFYLMVVSYIYFTRIIVYLVDATLPFRLIWLGDFFTEAATIVFFCVTGYKFRPSSDNPYFSLSDDDEEEQSEMKVNDVTQ